MLVYRFMSKKELDLFLSGDMEKIGNTFVGNGYERCNNHDYKNEEKYIHIFRYIKDFDYIYAVSKFEYFIAFDIPMVTLMSSRGRGYYELNKHGKTKSKSVREYAMNTKMMKAEYFIDYIQSEVVSSDKKKRLEFISKCKELINNKNEIVEGC